jgi:hypothetical protein
MEILAAYFIRLCTDYFRSFDLFELLDKSNQLGENLFSRSNATSLQSLANACVWASLMMEKTDSNYKNWPHQNDSAINSTHFILQSIINFSQFRCRKKGDSFFNARVLLYLDYLEQGKPSTHPYKGFESYGFLAIKALAILADIGKRDTNLNGLEMKTSNDIFAKTFQGLADSQGVSSQYSLAKLQEKWREALYIGYEQLISSAERVKQRAKIVDPTNKILCEVYSTATIANMSGNCMLIEEQLIGNSYHKIVEVVYEL